MSDPRRWADGGRDTQTGRAGRSTSTTIPADADSLWHDAAERVNGMYVAVVYVSDDKVRRRCFVTLAAAQRHADRARERGQECSVVLAELRPCHVLSAAVA